MGNFSSKKAPGLLIVSTVSLFCQKRPNLKKENNDMKKKKKKKNRWTEKTGWKNIDWIK